MKNSIDMNKIIVTSIETETSSPIDIPIDIVGGKMQIDITATVGDLFPATQNIEWPMYSYSRPAYMLWNAIANTLLNKGWTLDEIKDWLQSKDTRWALDGTLGNQIVALGEKYASKIPDSEKTR